MKNNYESLFVSQPVTQIEPSEINEHQIVSQPVTQLVIINRDIDSEYALKNINQPIGVSEYQLTKLFPIEFKSSLPSIDALEAELKKLDIEK